MAQLRQREYSSRELTDACLEQIESINPRLGVAVFACTETARQAADHADRALASGVDLGPLQGIPLGLKDVISTEDAPTRAQSMVPIEGFDGVDSTLAMRLRASGAVIICKASCSEFACGSPDPALPFAAPLNPWDTTKWAGGSSGGNASGVAAGCFLGGFGTDTGGSIRVPAAFCGVTGFKPSHGLVPTGGVVPVSTSLDHVGPIARTAWDCAALMDAGVGHVAIRHPAVKAARDSSSLSPPDPSYLDTLSGDLDGLRLGFIPPAEGGYAERCVSDALDALRAAGATITEVDLPYRESIFVATNTIISAELLEYHHESLVKYWDLYGRPTRMIIARGMYYSAADYVRAVRILENGRQVAHQLFGGLHAIVSLTVNQPACAIGEINLNLRQELPKMTAIWNGLRMPSISIPIGFSGSMTDGPDLPVGLQISGDYMNDHLVLRIADAYQRQTEWHLSRPPARDMG